MVAPSIWGAAGARGAGWAREKWDRSQSGGVGRWVGCRMEDHGAPRGLHVPPPSGPCCDPAIACRLSGSVPFKACTLPTAGGGCSFLPGNPGLGPGHLLPSFLTPLGFTFHLCRMMEPAQLLCLTNGENPVKTEKCTPECKLNFREQ